MFYICTKFKRLASCRAIFSKLIVGAIIVLTNSMLFGQRHEIGVRMGMSNLVGDIGRTNYVLQKPLGGNISSVGLPFYGGILYRMNFNPYQTLRFDFGYSHIQFDDAAAKETYRRNRGYSGTNDMAHLDVVFEYNFFPVNEEQRSMVSPYIFGGLGAMLPSVMRLTSNNNFRVVGGEYVAPTQDQDFITETELTTGRKLVMSIPFGAGLKYKFNYNWAISGEFMFRPTFTDGIDYSQIDDKDVKIVYSKDILMPNSNKSYLNQSPYKEVAAERANEIVESRKIGNVNSKDWVNTVSVSLTYSFGRPPCYCE